MSVPWTPSQECSLYVPLSMSHATSRSMAFEGIAKPKPCEFVTIAVVIPTTCPLLLSKGPPELPGFMGASNCMMLAMA